MAGTILFCEGGLLKVSFVCLSFSFLFITPLFENKVEPLASFVSFFQ